MKTTSDLINEFVNSEFDGTAADTSDALYDFPAVHRLAKKFAIEAVRADRAALRKQMLDRRDLQTIDNFPFPELL